MDFDPHGCTALSGGPRHEGAPSLLGRKMTKERSTRAALRKGACPPAQKLLSSGSSHTTSSRTDRHRPSGRRPPEPAEPGPLRSVDHGGEKRQRGRPLLSPLPTGQLARHGDRGVSGGIDPGRQGEALAGPGARGLMGQAPHAARCSPRVVGLGPRASASPASSAGHRPFHTGERSAVSACCFAGKLRSLAHSPSDRITPPSSGSFSTATPTHTTCVPPRPPTGAIAAGSTPSWGQSPARTRGRLAPLGKGAAFRRHSIQSADRAPHGALAISAHLRRAAIFDGDPISTMPRPSTDGTSQDVTTERHRLLAPL